MTTNQLVFFVLLRISIKLTLARIERDFREMVMKVHFGQLFNSSAVPGADLKEKFG